MTSSQPEIVISDIAYNLSRTAIGDLISSELCICPASHKAFLIMTFDTGLQLKISPDYFDDHQYSSWANGMPSYHDLLKPSYFFLPTPLKGMQAGPPSQTMMSAQTRADVPRQDPNQPHQMYCQVASLTRFKDKRLTFHARLGDFQTDQSARRFQR